VHWWVAPKLFFVHGESIITNSFQHMVKWHLTIIKSEANVIWGEIRI
jgi:hypothetical protein